MACLKNPDWMKNGSQILFKDMHGFDRDYYDCGKYYFDGTFNVVEFPKGMSLYHGSVNLTAAGYSYPLPTYYDLSSPDTMLESDKRLVRVARQQDINQQDNKKFKKMILTRDSNLTPGWYGDYEVAAAYAAAMGKYGKAKDKVCYNSEKRGCIYAYKLKDNIKLILMSDAYNVAVLLAGIHKGRSSEDMATSFKEKYGVFPDVLLDAIRQDYGINDDISSYIRCSEDGDCFHPLKKLLNKLNRESSRFSNYALPNLLCKYSATHDYAGFGNHRTRNRDKSVRMAEVILCNPHSSLERDYDSPVDWQHNPSPAPSSDSVELGSGIRLPRLLIETMKQYSTSNMSFHGGDPYDHSVWTALWAEEAILKSIPDTEFDKLHKISSNMWINIEQFIRDVHIDPKYLKRKIVLAAYLHDIGKFGDGRKVYYNKPNHPRAGYEYLMGTAGFKYLNGKVVNLRKHILSMNGGMEELVDFMAWISDSHYQFGNAIKQVEMSLGSGVKGKVIRALKDKVGVPEFETINTVAGAAAKEYIEKICASARRCNNLFRGKQREHVFVDICSLILISIADVMASLAPENTIRGKEGNQIAIENKRSLYFPFISNRSKPYRGRDAYRGFDYPFYTFMLYGHIKNLLVDIGTEHLDKCIGSAAPSVAPQATPVARRRPTRITRQSTMK